MSSSFARTFLILCALLVSGCGDRQSGPPSGQTDVPPGSSAGPDSPSGPTVLSVAEGSGDGSVSLNPIAVVEGGVFREAGGESQAQAAAFLAAHFAPGHSHALLVGGQQIGTLAVASAEVSEVGSGFDVSGAATLDGPVPLEWTALSGGVPAARPLRRSLTPTERRFFLDAAGSALSARYSGFDYDALQYGLRAVALEGFAQPVLAGTVKTAGPSGATDSFGEPVEYTALVVAEIVEGGAYQSVFSRLGEGVGYEEGSGQVSLVDVADIDGDGTPEVVVEVNHYEGVSFEVYGRRGGRWRQLFAGGYIGV